MILFQDSISEALRELITALGGAKKVGSEMRPEKSADEAGRWLSDCLNSDRRDRLTPEQLIWLLRRGRAIDCHVAMNFLCADAGYEEAKPISQVDERAKLAETISTASKTLSSALAAIERLKL